MAVITISPDQITKKKRKGPKGHAVDLTALDEVQSLIADESRQRDLLIEHLHKIQDQYQHISSKHLVALAHNRLRRQMQDHVGRGALQGRVQGFRIADVRLVMTGQHLANPGDREVVGLGRRRERVPRNAGAQTLEPQAEPRALEARVSGHENGATGKCFCKGDAHG